MTIQARLVKASSTIVLNAAEITFGDVRITAAGRTQSAQVVLDEKSEQATFRVGAPLPAGALEIAMRYEGLLNDDLRPARRDSAPEAGGLVSGLADANSNPNPARFASW